MKINSLEGLKKISDICEKVVHTGSRNKQGYVVGGTRTPENRISVTTDHFKLFHGWSKELGFFCSVSGSRRCIYTKGNVRLEVRCNRAN